jgi:hypothetical protein
MPLVVGLAAVAWLDAWQVSLPHANWVAYDLLGLERGSHLSTREQVASWLGVA